jgi:hypothetical protein
MSSMKERIASALGVDEKVVFSLVNISIKVPGNMKKRRSK